MDRNRIADYACGRKPAADIGVPEAVFDYLARGIEGDLSDVNPGAHRSYSIPYGNHKERDDLYFFMECIASRFSAKGFERVSIVKGGSDRQEGTVTLNLVKKEGE